VWGRLHPAAGFSPPCPPFAAIFVAAEGRLEGRPEIRDFEVGFMVLVTPRLSRCALLAIVITWAFGLPTANAQTFDLSDATALAPVNVKVAAAEYKGRSGKRP
jgi:hypothetical protein